MEEWQHPTTPHALAFMEPSEWDTMRERVGQGYQRRYGVAAPVHPNVAKETDAQLAEGYARIRGAQDRMQQALATENPRRSFL